MGDHLSFGGATQRFDGNKDVFTGHTAPLANPSPGDYEGKPLSQSRGGAAVKDKRRAPVVGCTTDAVGPGSYGATTESGLLKKTFNVTTQAPVYPVAGRPRKGAAAGNTA